MMNDTLGGEAWTRLDAEEENCKCGGCELIQLQS